jgi:hypothetical protein
MPLFPGEHKQESGEEFKKKLRGEKDAPTKFNDPCDQQRVGSMLCMDQNNYKRWVAPSFLASYSVLVFIRRLLSLSYAPLLSERSVRR